MLLAQDDVHGVGYCRDAVYFPHNIGIGAANDEKLAYQMGLITANEAKQCHLMWNLYSREGTGCRIGKGLCRGWYNHHLIRV